MFAVNVEGAIYKDGKWLVIERGRKESHAAGELALAGGKAEQEGHTTNLLERTVKREIFEEVGLLVSDHMHYVRNTSFIANGVHVVDIVFLCEYESGEAFNKSPDEVEAVFWMTTDEILQNPAAPIWLKDSIKQAELLRRSLEKI
ncbi:NUDIX domain-containing protein [Bacillus sp. ISL-47]|uniref:NUDIX hydrolase n=1 Tax=Bacillus sp. ISL-47 TaxID=2819130 RepID=UPI001BE7B09D|nr:NUDIX domain-containing protein [Bacillus sp. ISL-47]MBT2688416.1 NUDIX domain-containing protein [Bacillus sp. ISL-47]MBT2707268.1 NUDIX domain-containing protein [Pseudomonas sp. ISL-84]